MVLHDLRIVFMGTPEFAVASLKGLIDAGCNVVAVVTAPDRPSGRGQKIQETDVKRFALAYPDILMLQPEKLRDPEFTDTLQALKPDLFVVVAFRMLPEIVWSIPKHGTINLHASLLPQYRGAAPINWAIINGENKTGVTTFFIEREIDTGKIIMSQEVAISEIDNAGSLHDKLMLTGANLLIETVSAIASDSYEPWDQTLNKPLDTLKAAPKIFKETCSIYWNQPLKVVYNFVRGLSPYPAAWTTFVKDDPPQRFSVKIYESTMEEEEHNHTPGTIFSDDKKFLKIATFGGFLHLLTLQLEGKKRLSVTEFLHGFKGSPEYHAE